MRSRRGEEGTIRRREGGEGGEEERGGGEVRRRRGEEEREEKVERRRGEERGRECVHLTDCAIGCVREFLVRMSSLCARIDGQVSCAITEQLVP